MTKVSFKERVKEIVIAEAKAYNDNFVKYEYLVCSEAFILKDFYIIDAKEDNYQHLTGVNSLISSQQFFEKCYNGTLQESDFNFMKHHQSEKAVIGSVRRKIIVLPSVINIFNNKKILVEETFIKNNVQCSFATTDSVGTLGFLNISKSYPKTLLRGNELESSKAKNVDLLLRKESGKEKFDEILIGNLEAIKKYYEKIKNEIDQYYEEVAIGKI